MKRLMKRPLLFLALGVLALTLVAVPDSQAQEPVTDDEVNEVARDLYCPVCENTPLDVCPTQACQDWRAEIRAQLGQGKTEEEIQQYFVERYGARVLAEPPSEGFNLIVWILPVLAVVVGGFFFVRFLRNLQQSDSAAVDSGTSMEAQASAVEPPPPADDDYISRVEEEVRKG